MAAMLMSSASYGLRSTDFEAYTDPDFVDYTFRKILLVSEGGFETNKIVGEILTKEFAKRKIGIVLSKRLFPPTRDWSSEDRNRVMLENEIDAVLVVTPGASSASIMPAMTHTYGSGSGNYNSGSGNFNVSGSANTYQFYSASSTAGFSAILFDVRTSRTAWYMDILTKAAGTFFVSNKGDAKAAAKAVIKGLIENKHLNKK
jgi:hypothetical protein